MKRATIARLPSLIISIINCVNRVKSEFFLGKSITENNFQQKMIYFGINK